MKRIAAIAFCASLAVGASVAKADVVVRQDGSRIHVEIDGKPYGDLVMDPQGPKPYFYPLRSASGKIVTRQYPMVEDTKETRDHLHHRGVWLGYQEVNGFIFWENELTYKKQNMGKILLRKVDEIKSGKKAGTIRATFDWVDPSGNKILTENRTMIFRAEQDLRMLDFEVTLTAVVKTTFGDDKDGVFAVRVADPLREQQGGVITNSRGARTMKELWGKPAEWVDYNGTIEGEDIGIAMFDHPSSFRFPSRWHARDYGLFAVNPFGAQAFDKTAPKSEVTLEPGKSLHLKYRVLIHPKMDQAKIEELYKQWAAQK